MADKIVLHACVDEEGEYVLPEEVPQGGALVVRETPALPALRAEDVEGFSKALVADYTPIQAADLTPQEIKLQNVRALAAAQIAEKFKSPVHLETAANAHLNAIESALYYFANNVAPEGRTPKAETGRAVQPVSSKTGRVIQPVSTGRRDDKVAHDIGLNRSTIYDWAKKIHAIPRSKESNFWKITDEGREAFVAMLVRRWLDIKPDPVETPSDAPVDADFEEEKPVRTVSQIVTDLTKLNTRELIEIGGRIRQTERALGLTPAAEKPEPVVVENPTIVAERDHALEEARQLRKQHAIDVNLIEALKRENRRIPELEAELAKLTAEITALRKENPQTLENLKKEYTNVFLELQALKRELGGDRDTAVLSADGLCHCSHYVKPHVIQPVCPGYADF